MFFSKASNAKIIPLIYFLCFHITIIISIILKKVILQKKGCINICMDIFIYNYTHLWIFMRVYVCFIHIYTYSCMNNFFKKEEFLHKHSLSLRRSISTSNEDLKHLQRNNNFYYYTYELKIISTRYSDFHICNEIEYTSWTPQKLWKDKDDTYTSKNYIHSSLMASNQLQRLRSLW